MAEVKLLDEPGCVENAAEGFAGYEEELYPEPTAG
jgi:hypothetical protein